MSTTGSLYLTFLTTHYPLAKCSLDKPNLR